MSGNDTSSQGSTGSTGTADFGVSPKVASATAPTPTPTLPVKITLRGTLKKTTQNNTTPTSVDGTNVSDLLSGNDTDVEITPDTANNKVYICSCCVDTTFCRIM
jgi:hypothetical protein